MSMTHDDSRGRGISYHSPGLGMSITFRCGSCSTPSISTGSGVRLVHGLKQKVCRNCKSNIDMKRRAA